MTGPTEKQQETLRRMYGVLTYPIVEDRQEFVAALAPFLVEHDAARWTECSDGMPERPFESSVPMCLTYGDEGIDFGFWNGERWLGSDGTTRGVTHWLLVPEPPDRASQCSHRAEEK
jgi:hypothetical protein